MLNACKRNSNAIAHSKWRAAKVFHQVSEGVVVEGVGCGCRCVGRRWFPRWLDDDGTSAVPAKGSDESVRVGGAHVEVFGYGSSRLALRQQTVKECARRSLGEMDVG